MISPVALSLLLVALVYGWAVPLPTAPSEKYSRMEFVNGTWTYHERDVNEEEKEKDVFTWNISLSKLYSPQVRTRLHPKQIVNVVKSFPNCYP